MFPIRSGVLSQFHGATHIVCRPLMLVPYAYVLLLAFGLLILLLRSLSLLGSVRLRLRIHPLGLYLQNPPSGKVVASFCQQHTHGLMLLSLLHVGVLPDTLLSCPSLRPPDLVTMLEPLTLVVPDLFLSWALDGKAWRYTLRTLSIQHLRVQ